MCVCELCECECFVGGECDGFVDYYVVVGFEYLVCECEMGVVWCGDYYIFDIVEVE